MLPFGKIKEIYLQNFINGWNIDQCSWMGISINTAQYRHYSNNLQVESLCKDQQNMLRWGQDSQEKDMHLDLIKNKKMIKQGKGKRKDTQIFQKIIAEVLHQHLLRSREQMISWARNLQLDGQNIPQDEEKTLEWIKVSLKILKKAMENAIQDQNSTVQMMLFSGKKNGQFHFKLRIYNLDIELLATDSLPQLIVHDKKRDQDFCPTHQVLKGHLHGSLNPIINEIIQLLPLLETLIRMKVITLN